MSSERSFELVQVEVRMDLLVDAASRDQVDPIVVQLDAWCCLTFQDDVLNAQLF